jgi:hypothetical protein
MNASHLSILVPARGHVELVDVWAATRDVMQYMLLNKGTIGSGDASQAQIELLSSQRALIPSIIPILDLNNARFTHCAVFDPTPMCR